MEVLEKIKKDVAGVIGSIAIDKEGKIKFSNLPSELDENLSYVSQATYLLVKNIESTRGYERILVEGERGRVFIVNSDEGDLIFVMDNRVNLALFKIIIEKAKAQLKIGEMPTTIAPAIEEKKVLKTEISEELIDEIISQIKSKLSGFGGSTMAENVVRKHMSKEIRTAEDLEKFVRSICSAEIAQIFGLTVARNLERRLLEKIKGGRV